MKGNPQVYELSFSCPRGLSGAPLIAHELHQVSGLIFGNSRSDIVVFSEKELDAEKGETVIREKVESLHLGLAIQAGYIFDIPSQLLGCTIREHLTKHGLLTPPAASAPPSGDQ